MLDVLHAADLRILRLLNGGLENPLFDAVLPGLTDWAETPLGLACAAALIAWMAVAGGAAGRRTAVLLLLVVAFADWLNSEVVKSFFERPRPCRTLDDLRVLVGCGRGSSFPSSHAVNNAALATVLAGHFPRRAWAPIGFAALVAFSRVYVGVHYPSDVLAGAALGVGLAGGAMALSAWLSRGASVVRARRSAADTAVGASSPSRASSSLAAWRQWLGARG
ncbi:MAG TPA: phosphatase PAP2 family protein, partial [Gemmatimonadota bacterium]